MLSREQLTIAFVIYLINFLFVFILIPTHRQNKSNKLKYSLVLLGQQFKIEQKAFCLHLAAP